MLDGGPVVDMSAGVTELISSTKTLWDDVIDETSAH